MARTVDPAEVFGARTARGAQYGWVAWCDGQGHELKRGDDLAEHVSTSSTRSAFRQWAARNGFDTKAGHVRTSVPDDDTMVIYVEHTARNRKAFVNRVRQDLENDVDGFNRERFGEMYAEAKLRGNAKAVKAWDEALNGRPEAAKPAAEAGVAESA